MIVPSASDLLRCIEETLETVIRPALTGTNEKSALASISHLLRHVRLRVDGEGQLLADDVRALDTLLGAVGRYLQESDAAATRPILARIEAARHAAMAAPRSYPSLAEMGQFAGTLRAALTDSLRHLQAIQGAEARSAPYLEVRRAIRDYLGRELLHEGEMIHPAFAGRGPRR